MRFGPLCVTVCAAGHQIEGGQVAAEGNLHVVARDVGGKPAGEERGVLIQRDVDPLCSRRQAAVMLSGMSVAGLGKRRRISVR